MISFLGKLAHRVFRSTSFPFRLKEVDKPDERVISLFQKSFGALPPVQPRHFCAICQRNESLAAYIHYKEQEPGVFLIGGLCVDSRTYKNNLTAHQRKIVSNEGSLSRWVLDRSIASLGKKRAIFAYTGNTCSRRDIISLGFVSVQEPYLFVQWHEEPKSERQKLINKIGLLGPF